MSNPMRAVLEERYRIDSFSFMNHPPPLNSAQRGEYGCQPFDAGLMRYDALIKLLFWMAQHILLS